MWNLSFISEQDFTAHVQETIIKYGEKLKPINLKKFNKNIIDPIKLVFDKTVYNLSWEEIINSELLRQRDKSNNNDIGYFHQNMFKYIKNCSVPTEGWDVIFKDDNGIKVYDDVSVNTVFVEMKNKRNTMNSSSSGKTFIKMQSQLLSNNNCACFLVEAIAQKSQNIMWNPTVDKVKVGHNLIRRVSIDKFYSLVTGQDDAFYQICMILPEIIQKVVKSLDELQTSEDTVMAELKEIAIKQSGKDDDFAISMAVYMLGFGSYKGF